MTNKKLQAIIQAYPTATAEEVAQIEDEAIYHINESIGNFNSYHEEIHTSYSDAVHHLESLTEGYIAQQVNEGEDVDTATELAYSYYAIEEIF